jgi:dienelactone hydrolase
MLDSHADTNGCGHGVILEADGLSQSPVTQSSKYSSGMSTVILFHHAQGQTSGFLDFAEELRAAGHTVHTPDLYEGRTFQDLNEGVSYAQEVGFGEIMRRGIAAAEGLPAEVVYAGFSLGVMPAQALTQTRPGAKGALFFSAAIPASEFDSPWPDGVPLQIHIMEEDEWSDEDRVAAKGLVEEVADAELFLYPGSSHLFADPSLTDYDEEAAGLLKQRTLAFLQRVG